MRLAADINGHNKRTYPSNCYWYMLRLKYTACSIKCVTNVTSHYYLVNSKERKKNKFKIKYRMGEIFPAWNPSNLGGWGRWIAEAQEFETSLGNIGRSPHPVSTKKKKSQVWWYTPVVLATQEAEVRGPLELKKSKLLWAMIGPLYSSLDERVIPCLRK